MKFWGYLIGATCIVFMTGGAIADDKKGDDKKLDDNKFVEKVSSSGRMEIALGRIAQVRAQNEEVRKFGARMIEDHTKANNKLILIISEARIPITEEPLPEHQKVLKHLQEVDVKNFDEEYMKQMVESHEKAVDMFTKASKELKNEKLRNFAKETLPTLKEHLTMAKKVRDQVK